MYNLCLYVLPSLWAFDTAASKILTVHVPYHICVYDNKLDLTYVSLTLIKLAEHLKVNTTLTTLK